MNLTTNLTRFLNLPNFEIVSKGKYLDVLDDLKITHFHELCSFVMNLLYGRNSSRDDFSLLFSENKGTCTSKHGVLQEIVELNHVQEIELMVGIFLMNETYNPKLKQVLEKYKLDHIPEAHCFLRFDDKRFDFTTKYSDVSLFEPYLVREQRCESQQLIDWKPMIHKRYIESWIKRKNLNYSPQQIWDIREECLRVF